MFHVILSVAFLPGVRLFPFGLDSHSGLCLWGSPCIDFGFTVDAREWGAKPTPNVSAGLFQVQERHFQRVVLFLARFSDHTVQRMTAVIEHAFFTINSTSARWRVSSEKLCCAKSQMQNWDDHVLIPVGVKSCWSKLSPSQIWSPCKLPWCKLLMFWSP